MARIFYKIMRVRSERGLVGIIKSLMSRITSWIFTAVDDIVISKSLDDLRAYSLPKKLKTIRLEEFNIERFKEFCQDNHCTLNNRRNLNSVLHNKHRGFVATLDGEIIGYIWWTDNQISPHRNHPFLHRYGIDLMNDEAYFFDFFILPQYRGDGNAVEFLATVEFILKEQGFRRVYGHVLVDNKPARWLYILNGYKETRRVKSLKIFKLILIANNRIFIKNNKLYSSYSFDYRPISYYSSAREISLDRSIRIRSRAAKSM